MTRRKFLKAGLLFVPAAMASGQAVVPWRQRSFECKQCPVVSAYPTFTAGSSNLYDIYPDIGSRRAFANDYQADKVQVISTASNTKVTTYTGLNQLGGNVFGTFGICFVPQTNSVVTKSQAHGFSYIDLGTGVWSSMVGGASMAQDAGVHRYVCCDTKRGHVMATAYATSPNCEFEVVDGHCAPVHVSSGLTQSLQECPVYSAAADKFLAVNGADTPTFPFYYIDPETWAITPSGISSNIKKNAGIPLCVVDGLNAVIFQLGDQAKLVDLGTDSIVQSLTISTNGLNGAAYDSCANLLHINDGSFIYTYNTLTWALAATSANVGAKDMCFDPCSGLTYVTTGGTGIITI